MYKDTNLEGAVMPIDSTPLLTFSPLAHTHSSFAFILDASVESVAPLFGAEGERRWAGPHWDPRFLYPQPPQDIEGAVFVLEGSDRRSFWVNTSFDLQAGRLQYAVFAPRQMVTIIDVQLTAKGDASTQVDVTYRRTALRAEANGDVEERGRSDAAQGPQWQSAIAAALSVR